MQRGLGDGLLGCTLRAFTDSPWDYKDGQGNGRASSGNSSLPGLYPKACVRSSGNHNVIFDEFD